MRETQIERGHLQRPAVRTTDFPTRETQVDRGSPERAQTYRVNVGQPLIPLEKQVAMLTADMNRLLGDIAQRLDRLEQRVTKLEKE